MTMDFGAAKAGEKAELYVLENEKGMKAQISTYGATLVSLLVPDKKGTIRDVVLGYEDVSGYETSTTFFGATIGRMANRIGGAAFVLNGKKYVLTANDNGNNLHSGDDFYNKRIWKVAEADTSCVVLTLVSPDGDQGYPGQVEIEVSYTLSEENELKIHYRAVPAEDTVMNLTNHSYFNLSGQDSGDVLGQTVWIYADAYTEVDQDLISTGEVVSVYGTPMDFRTPKEIGEDIAADYEALRIGNGYDHNYVLCGTGNRKVASMYSRESGITMEVVTDLPGMQFYTGNFIETESGKGGNTYKKRQGACFETQLFPDAVNKDHFKSPIVKKGQVYETETTYRFL